MYNCIRKTKEICHLSTSSLLTTLILTMPNSMLDHSFTTCSSSATSRSAGHGSRGICMIVKTSTCSPASPSSVAGSSALNRDGGGRRDSGR
jgi:hypothetical protein